MRLILWLFLVLVTSYSAEAQVRIVLYPQGHDPADVELFISQPEGRFAKPVILFVHGHQSPPRPGGRVFTRLDAGPRWRLLMKGG